MSRSFFFRNGGLWKRGRKDLPQLVVVEKKKQKEILKGLHEDIAHRGRDAIMRKISDRYWWPQLYQTVKDHVRSCSECQYCHPTREHETLHPTEVSQLFQKVVIDTVHMGKGSGHFPYLIVTRDDLSGWVEGRELRTKTAVGVAKFRKEMDVSRFGSTIEFVVSDTARKTKEKLKNCYRRRASLRDSQRPITRKPMEWLREATGHW